MGWASAGLFVFQVKYFGLGINLEGDNLIKHSFQLLPCLSSSSITSIARGFVEPSGWREAAIDPRLCSWDGKQMVWWSAWGGWWKERERKWNSSTCCPKPVLKHGCYTKRAWWPLRWSGFRLELQTLSLDNRLCFNGLQPEVITKGSVVHTSNINLQATPFWWTIKLNKLHC